MTTTDRPRFEASEPSPPDASAQSGSGASQTEPTTPIHHLRPVVVSGGVYLLLGVLLWWKVWTSHPTSTTTCGCGDSSLFTWFLDWPAYALSHGLNPLYSTAMFHPVGINLLSNTAEVGFGVVLAPITWLFGPVATLNVALTLSPVLSALAMFILLRRWVTWTPAAFMGGLFYGFSPFVLISLTDAHLMIGAAFIPPLLVACLDELLLRQRRRPVLTGVMLGLLVVVQFFIGTEVLIIMAIAVGFGVVVLVAYGLFRRRDVVRSHAQHALVASYAAVATAGVLLAYPVWFVFAGPAHLSGNIWDNALLSYGGANFRGYFLPEPASQAVLNQGLRWGGYQAPTLSGQYFGLGLVAVLLVGFVLWRKDRRLWFFGLVSVFSVLLSFGLGLHNWSLWRLFVRFPLMENVIPSRFLLVTYLAVAVMLGVILDRTYRGVRTWWGATATGPADRAASRNADKVGRRVAAVVGVLAGAIAIGPIASYYSTGLPFTATPVVVPLWFRTVAPTLSTHQVVLAFPAPFDLTQSAMTWQAVDNMSYSMVGGGGPDSILPRAGKEEVGQHILGDYSVSTGRSAPTLPEVTAVRGALDGWGVTTIVVPDPTRLPLYERVSHVRSLVVLLTAATGERPVRQADAWVWTQVNHAGPAVFSSAAALNQCTLGAPVGSVASIDEASTCALASPAVG
jgi:hypothetical protein